MAEMDPGFNQLLYQDCGHEVLLASAHRKKRSRGGSSGVVWETVGQGEIVPPERVPLVSFGPFKETSK
jgi:hypothetical protein